MEQRREQNEKSLFQTSDAGSSETSLWKTCPRSAIKKKLAVHSEVTEKIRYAGLVSAATLCKPLCVPFFLFSTETGPFPDDLDFCFGAKECTARKDHSGDS